MEGGNKLFYCVNLLQTSIFNNASSITYKTGVFSTHFNVTEHRHFLYDTYKAFRKREIMCPQREKSLIWNYCNYLFILAKNSIRHVILSTTMLMRHFKINAIDLTLNYDLDAKLRYAIVSEEFLSEEEI